MEECIVCLEVKKIKVFNCNHGTCVDCLENIKKSCVDEEVIDEAGYRFYLLNRQIIIKCPMCRKIVFKSNNTTSWLKFINRKKIVTSTGSSWNFGERNLKGNLY